MKGFNSKFLTLVLLVLISFSAVGQRGKIIRAASASGTAVMDPNGDGYVTKPPPTMKPFSNDGYYVDEFEITMFGIPQLGGDVTGDNIGANCGITDLIPDNKGYSTYAVRDANNNLIFRFRVGDDNPSVEAWTILLDTDGLYGIGIDPNATADNPGFEIDITLIKRNNAGVYVYNIDGIESCPTEDLFYSIDDNFQISIGDEVTCGDPDYLYDFYVPFADIAAEYGINVNTGLRYVALVNVSATCAMSGSIADVSGVDNNDPDYANCPVCAFDDLVNAQCPTPVVDLCETCEGFEKDKVSKPTINEPIRAGQTYISGTTVESDIYIKLEIFENITPPGPGGVPAGTWQATARETHIVATTGTTWIANLNAALIAYDKIVATALKTPTSTPCGANGDNSSSTSVTVVTPNTPPVAIDQNVLVDEDTPELIVLTATDPENDPLTYSIVSPPSNGVLTGTPPNVTYTPNLNYVGPDSFTFQVSDGIFNSVVPGTVSITVVAINDAPIANNQSVTTPEDTPVGVTLTASDVDGDVLSYIIVTPPSNGVLSGTAPNLTYTPNLNYFGPDSFTFKVNDGTVDSNTATVSITVTPVSDAPIADDQSLTTPEETPLPIVLTGNDPDGNVVTFIIVTQPTNGTLTGTGANVTYTPNLNYNGPDSFTFKVNDGTTESNVATVSITVTPVEDAPIANNQSVTTPEDTPVGITLTGSDPDGDVLTFTVLTQPANGILSGTAPNLTYTPNANYFGADSFTFKVTANGVDSNIATVSITVTPVNNDAPVANNLSITTPEDTPVSFTLTGNDPDGDALTYVVLTQPSNGTLSGTAPNLTYTPNLNYFGADSFTFKIVAGGVDSNVATVSITVTPVNNDAPVANNLSVTTPEDTPVGITLTGNDPDGDALTFTVLTQPTHGTLSGTAPNLTYTPDLNYNGPDSFTFKITAGGVDSNVATVSITVTPVNNDAPIANNLNITTPEDTPVGVTLSGIDPDGTAVTYVIVSGPTNGTLSGTAPNLTYTPSLNYNGADSFTYKVTSNGDDSNIATVSITVTPVEDAPVANNQSVTTPEDTPIGITLTGNDPDGDALTFTVITQPAHGTLTGTAPNLTYTPDLNYTGADSFTFKVTANGVDSNVATVSITVTPVNNDVPIANNLNITTPEDTPVAVTLSGSDPDGTAVTYVIVSNPTNGTLSGTAPNLTYTPNLNYNGADSFTYKVTSNGDDSNIATVTITVTPVNDAPIANSQNVTYDLDTPEPVTLTGSDVDGDPLTFIVLTNPTNGTLSGTAPNLTYTPNTGFTGTDSFTFRVNDGSLNSNIATVTLNLTPVTNSAPVAQDQSDVIVIEDVPETIIVTATDVDGDPLTYIIVTPPAHGTLTGSGPNYVYTPDPNYNGPDSFTFKVNDGTVDSNVATVTITVVPVADAPIANNLSVTTPEDIPVGITLTGSDADGDALTFVVLTQPTNGTLSGTAPNLTYTPNLNYNGPDSFTFKITAGGVDSNTATVSITVTPVDNDLPIANNLTVTTPEDTPVGITLSGNDPDGTPVTYVIVSGPTNGTLSGSAPGLTYTPNANYNGSDSFTYKVTSNGDDSNVATVSITVTPVADAPIANNLSVTTPEDTPVGITLTGSDADGDALTFVVLTQPANGTLSGTAPNLTYTPNLNYNGPDSFTFKITAGGVDSNTATVSITVTPVDNDLPIANNLTVTTPEDTPVGITLSGNDPDGTPVTYVIVTGPTNGTLSGSAPGLTYIPNANYNGPDSFTYKVTSNGDDSNVATVSITVTPVSDAPVAESQSLTTPEDTPLSIVLVGSDPETTVTYVIVGGPSHGTLSGTAPNITYTPALNYNGADSFTFKVNDGTTDSNIATVVITVTPVNDAPVADNQSVTTAEDTPKAITLNGSDVDGDALTYTVVTGPANGSLSGTGANLVYTPALNYTGADSFTFKVSDGTLESGLATVTITVTPVNDAPVANSQLVITDEDTPVGIVLTGSDVENSPLTFVIVTGPARGTLSGTAPNITYTPALNYNGADSFTFRVNDGTSNSNVATVSIIVNPVNDAPVANNQNVTTPEDTPRAITLTGSDVDGDALTFTVLTQPANGVLSGTAPNVTYSPNANYFGTDSFTFKVNDGTVDSNTATVTITVTPVNDLPVANNQNVTLPEDTPTAITLTAVDSDGDALTYIVVTQPTHGVLTGTAPALTYTPALNYNGPDAFTFKVNDGTSDSNTALVSITVTPVNDPPVIIPVDFVPPAHYVYEDSVYDDAADPEGVCLEVVDPDVGDEITYNPNPVNVKGGGTMVLRTDDYDFCYIFTPAFNYNGESIWDFSVTDGEATATAQVKILVIPVNDKPMAVNDFLTMDGNMADTIDVLANDHPILIGYKEFYDIFEPDSVDNITVIGLVDGKGPYHAGSPAYVRADGRTIEYTPAVGYVGPDSLQYVIRDSSKPNMTDTAVLFIDVTYPRFKIYEGVSPNNDGKNDHWQIDGIEEHPNNVKVFDRFNNLVWQTDDYDNDSNSWKGQSNHGLGGNSLPEGTYYYTVYLKDKKRTYSGYVFLKRY